MIHVKAIVLLLVTTYGFVSSGKTISLSITKYNQHSHSKRANIHQARLFNNEGSEYLINIGIGTPMQNFTVSLDTGSSDLWVPSSTCPTEECPYQKFASSQSSTFTPLNDSQPFQIEYGIGSVNGTYGKDSVYLGNAHVLQQQFGLATSTRDLILPATSPSNGILGLGYPALTTSNTKYSPFVFQLAEQELIDQPIFSVSMGPVTETGWSGEILLGGTNPKKYTGDIVYEPIFNQDKSSTSYWMVGGSSIQVQKETTKSELVYNNTFPSARGMIVDTGTTLTYVDHDAAEAIVKMVTNDNAVFDQMSGTYIIDCHTGHEATTSYFLRFTLDRSGIQLNIPLRDLVLPLGEGVCMFGIAPWMNTGNSLKMKENDWILLGDSVLRSTYLVFDMKNHQVGFAKTASASVIRHEIASFGDTLCAPNKFIELIMTAMIVVFVSI